MLRRRSDDLPARMVDAGAILFTVLLVIFEIRHYITGGDIYQPVSDITEAAIDVNAGLALTIGLERVRGRTGSIVHNIGAMLIAALTLCGIVFELVVVASPRFYNEPVSGVFFKMILLGYGLPAVLAIILALIARSHAAPTLPCRRRDHGSAARAVLSDTRSAPPVPRSDHRRPNE